MKPWSWLGATWGGASKSARRSRRVLRCEALESRQLLSGEHPSNDPTPLSYPPGNDGNYSPPTENSTPGGVEFYVDDTRVEIGGLIDFGHTEVREAVVKSFTVRNGGDASIQLSPFISVPTGFMLDAGFTTTMLAPGESTSFTIRLDALTVGSSSGKLGFRSNGGQSFDNRFVLAGEVTVDIPSLLSIQSASDVETIRAALISNIWSGAGFPSEKMPAFVEQGVESPISGLANIASVDRITTVMELGVTSVAYFYHPSIDNGRLAIFQQGHADDLGAIGGFETIQRLLDSGFSVVAFWMPLLGPNTGPVGSHDDLVGLETRSLNPIKYFVEPIATTLNYLRGQRDYQDVSMIGISGGAWTTTLYAALDPTIKISVPVAGTLPEYLRAPDQVGDWEQYNPPLYQIANYLDLYVLGSYGAGRRQIQILNIHDPYVLPGTGYETYAEPLAEFVDSLGAGQFRVIGEGSQTDHRISNYALDTIILPALLGDGVEFSDNQYSGFSIIGEPGESVSGFGGDALRIQNIGGDSHAEWTFSDLAPGIYQVWATWPAGDDLSAEAHYTLSGAAVLGDITVDQRQAPSGLDNAGANWTPLGTVEVANGRLIVRLAGSGQLLADAVRVARVGTLSGAMIGIYTEDRLIVDGEAFIFADAYLDAPRSQTFTVRNDGAEPLTLSQPVVTGASFWLAEELGSLTLLAGESTTFVVEFAPTAPGDYSGAVTIDSNANARSTMSFQLAGLGGVISVRQRGRELNDGESVVRFGTAFVGEARERTFEITNRTTTNVTLSEANLPDGFALLGEFAPVTLAPGESTFISVVMPAESAGDRQGKVILSTDEGATFVFGVMGEVVESRIVDDGDYGYGVLGIWTSYINQGGYQGDTQGARPNDPYSIARWVLTDLAPGEYQVWGSWLPYYVRATNATYSIYDGNRLIKTVTIDQQLAPSGFTADGTTWQLFGSPINITSGQLVITLTNVANGQVVADAIRVTTSSSTSMVKVASTPTWHNAALGADVNGDGFVTPLDALLIINRLNTSGAGALAALAIESTGIFLDADGDDLLTPLDALIVINYLSRNPATSGALPLGGVDPHPLALDASDSRSDLPDATNSDANPTHTDLPRDILVALALHWAMTDGTESAALWRHWWLN